MIGRSLSKANTPNQIEKSIIVNISVSVKYWSVERRKKARNRKKTQFKWYVCELRFDYDLENNRWDSIKTIISLIIRAYKRISFYEWIVRCIIICPSFSRLLQCVFPFSHTSRIRHKVFEFEPFLFPYVHLVGCSNLHRQFHFGRHCKQINNNVVNGKID